MNVIKMTLIILAILLGVGIFYGLYQISKPGAMCLGPPYIYVTFHDQVKNVIKYSRNGCMLDDDVLIGGPKKQQKKSHRKEYRSMTIGPYKHHKKALYIADGNTALSTLMVYSECDASGHRHYLDTVVSSDTNPGVRHMYGVCLDDQDNVYVSSQHTDNVLHFKKDTFEPMVMPSRAEPTSNPYRSNYPGTFLQFGQPMLHTDGEQGVRAIKAVEGNIWIANEELESISIADGITGEVSTMIRIPRPIGMHYDRHHRLVFVSSKQRSRRSAVYAISVDTFKIVHTYRHHTLHHPAGVTTTDDILYIAGQNKGFLLKFSIKRAVYLGAVTKKLPPRAEQIVLSDC